VRVLIAMGLFAVAVGCLALGGWQVGRAGEKRVAHAARVALLEQPPLESGDGRVVLEAGRRVRLTGTWDRERHILLSGRTYLSAAGVQLVTPLVLGTGERVLVERGWMEAADARIAHPERWADSAAIAEGVVERPGTELWSARALDSAEVASNVPAPVARAWVRSTVAAGDTASARPGLVTMPFALPDSGERVHWAYAIQWFAFAIIFTAGAIALLRRHEPATAR
jgi:cytochrome oxidase assembly protein ShyY1